MRTSKISDTKAVTIFRDSISSQKKIGKGIYLELIGAVDHDKTFRLCVCFFFGEKKSI